MRDELTKMIRHLEIADYEPGEGAERLWNEVAGTAEAEEVRDALIEKCSRQAPEQMGWLLSMTKKVRGTGLAEAEVPDEPEEPDVPEDIEIPEEVEAEIVPADDPMTYTEAELYEAVRFAALEKRFKRSFEREAEEGGEVPEDFLEYQRAILARAKEKKCLSDVKMALSQARRKLAAAGKERTKQKKKEEKANAAAEAQEEKTLAAITASGARLPGYTDITMPKGPDGKPLYQQLKCDGYAVGDRGITAYDRDFTQVSLTPIIPIRELCNKGERGRTTVELAWPAYLPDDDGKPIKTWRTIELERSVIASDVKLAEALSGVGYSVSAKTKKDLSHYLTCVLAQNAGKIPLRWSTSDLGWAGDDCSEFLPYGRAITLNLSGDDRELGLAKIAAAVQSVRGTEAEWMEMMHHYRGKRRRDFLTALATIAAGPLAKPLGVNGFVVDITGKSGLGKTVLVLLAASFVGDPAKGRYVRAWADSKRAVEGAAGFLKNFCLVLDDTAVRHSTFATDEAIESVIYSIAGNGAPSLGTATGGVRNGQEFKLIGLSTSENTGPLRGSCKKGGGRNRVLEVPIDTPIVDCPAGELDAALNALVNRLDGCHGHGIRPWIAAITRIGKNELRRRYAEWNVRVAKTYGNKAGKQGDALALLLLADELLEQEIFHDGVRLDLEQMGDILLDDVEMDDNTRAYNLVREKISSEPFRFAESESGYELGKILQRLQRDWSTVSKGLYGQAEEKRRITEAIAEIGKISAQEAKMPTQSQYGFPDPKDKAFVNFYKDGLRKLLSDAGFGLDGFLRWAKKNDLLKIGKGRGADRNTTHLGNLVTVYTLDVSVADIAAYLADPEAYRAAQREEAARSGFAPVPEEESADLAEATAEFEAKAKAEQKTFMVGAGGELSA